MNTDEKAQSLSRAQELFMRGRLGAAAELLAHMMSSAPDDVDALHLMGVIAQQQRDPATAQRHLARAAALDASRADVLSNLANVLRELSRFDESLAHHERAAALAPGNALIHVNRGLLLQDMKRLDEAEQAFGKALAADPASAIAHQNLGHLLMLFDLPRARQHLIRALKLDSGLHAAFKDLCAVLISQGEAQSALTLVASRLSKVPGDQDALATLAIALRDLGRDSEADQLIASAHWLRQETISPPAGYSSLGDFNAALEAHVRRHPKLTSVLFGQATHHGQRVNDLLEAPQGPVGDLERLARERIQHYLEALPVLPDHPFFRQKREGRGRLKSWAVLMHRHGYETPHIHPDGLVSGVYYVRLPAVVANDASTHQGWIEFGEPDPVFAVRRRAPTHKVQPVAGQMLLFPSYLWHRTIPFDSDQERLSIAFDFAPTAGAA